MSERTPLQPVAGLARTANIPPPPRRTPTPTFTRTETQEDVTEATATTPPAETVARRRPASDQADTIRSTTLSMPVAVLQALKARAAADRVSQPDLLMDALSATHDQLEHLVQQANPPQSNDGLFVRRSASESGPLGTLSLRMLSRNITAIDDLATNSGAKSRSALCTAALKEYLKL